MQTQLLDGISVSGFRSFYGGRAQFSGLSKLNFLIGQNNSGKSNILRFLLEHANTQRQRPSKRTRDTLDSPQGLDDTNLELGILLKKDSELVDTLFDCFKTNKQRAQQLMFAAKGELWYYMAYDVRDDKFRSIGKALDETTKQIKLDEGTWGNLMSMMGFSGGNLQAWKQTVIDQINPRNHLQLKVDLIPSFRSLTYRIDNTDNRAELLFKHGGMGLLEELFKCQNPDIGAEKDRQRFDKIQNLFRQITGKEDALLEIPHDKSKIVVTMDRRRLPLGALGSGIEEVIIIAAISTIFDQQIVLIEEPRTTSSSLIAKKTYPISV